MKKQVALFLLAMLSIFFAGAAVNDTVWTTYNWSGIKISILGGDLHYFTTSTVLIEPENTNEQIEVSYDGGKVEKKDKHTFLFTPDKIGSTILRVNNRVFPLQVLPIPEPKIFLDGDSKNWFGVISIENLQKSRRVIVKNKFNKFEFIRGELTYQNKNGDLISIRLESDILPSGVFDELEPGQKIYVENVTVKDPDGSLRFLDAQTYRLIESYENEFIQKTIEFSPGSTDLNLLKTDLRIKIAGIPKSSDVAIVSNLAAELNDVLETIDVLIVDNRPNLTLIFDTAYNDSLLIKKGFERNDVGFFNVRNSLFFPFSKNIVMYVNTMSWSYSPGKLKMCIVKMLGNFSESYREIGKDSTIFNGCENLSYYDKYMLELLYSSGGEEKVSNNINEENVFGNKDGLYVLLLTFSICLLFLFSELYQYYGFSARMSRIRNKILKRLLESVLMAQVPVMALLVLLAAKFFLGDFHEANMLWSFEKFLVPFSIIVGFLFYSVDALLQRIKPIWLLVFVNLILSFSAIFAGYQLVFLFNSPEIIPVAELGWKVLLVGFLITLYRLYARSQSQKISGLLQKKELELTKQKELKFKSDLNALQARINPHFLYNSLNSIASLAHTDADKTEKMALSLSKLFRYNLNKGDEHDATLSDEVEMTKTYLEIEKIRFDDRMNFSIELADSLKDFRVPKFMLQPLAENAVKHGISKVAGLGVIAIKIFENDEKVFVEIHDNGPDFPGGLISGYGLQNTYEKLKWLYKKPFDVEFSNAPEKKLVLMLLK